MVAASKVTASIPELKEGFRIVINDGVQGCKLLFNESN